MQVIGDIEVRRKKKTTGKRKGDVYSCKKRNDLFLKELSNELGVRNV